MKRVSRKNLFLFSGISKGIGKTWNWLVIVVLNQYELKIPSIFLDPEGKEEGAG